MRIIVCECRVEYEGRINTSLDLGERMITIKADGSFSIQNDNGYKPLNYMTGGTIVKLNDVLVENGKPPLRGGGVLSVEHIKTGEKITVFIERLLEDHSFTLRDEAALIRVGNEKDFQEALSLSPERIEEGLRVVQRERPLQVGNIDIYCRDTEGKIVIVEVKRAVVTAADVDQLARYVEEVAIEEGGRDKCRGIFVAPRLMPQAEEIMLRRGLEYVPLSYQDVATEAKDKRLF